MPSVYNWQLGRQMQYPYEQASPKEQFAFVININRCIGCQTLHDGLQEHLDLRQGPGAHVVDQRRDQTLRRLSAALGCEDPRQVGAGQSRRVRRWSGSPNGDPKKPYGSTSPERSLCSKCRTPSHGAVSRTRFWDTCPPDEEWRFPNIYEDTPQHGQSKPMEFGSRRDELSGDKKHKAWFFYLARLCNHCSYPACLAACPRTAIYKRPEDGIVLIDQKECRGYRKCVEACPYKKSLYRGTTRTSEKCIACYPRVEGKDPETNGSPMETRCMAACIGQVRIQGLVKVDKDNAWIEDRYNPLYYLVHVAKVALPLYAQLGTEAQRLLHPAALGTPAVLAADVWSRRRACGRTVPQSGSRTSGGATALSTVQSDHLALPDRRGSKSLRDHARRQEIRDVQRYGHRVQS